MCLTEDKNCPVHVTENKSLKGTVAIQKVFHRPLFIYK